MGAEGSAAQGEQPDTGDAPPLRLAVIVGESPDASRVCRVDAPDRVLRVWAMLSVADDELHKVSLWPGAVARLQRQLAVVTAELERSLSPALAGELRHLFGRENAAVLTQDELRVEYASLLAWTGGLVIGILTQIEAASAKTTASSRRLRVVTAQ